MPGGQQVVRPGIAFPQVADFEGHASPKPRARSSDNDALSNWAISLRIVRTIRSDIPTPSESLLECQHVVLRQPVFPW